jgi:signal peptide peptidase SppA
MAIKLKLPDRLFRWRKGVTIPALRLSGVIGSLPLRGAGLTLSSLDKQIEALFADKNAPAAVLLLNSPGGSPVQSSLIAQRVRALSAEKKRPVIAFVEDVAASGGYWLACAADEIYADAASIVGSIGVVSAGFGFQNALARLGIERRLHTTGEHKGLLDPFRPEKPGDLEILKQLQDDIVQGFIGWVRSRRGERLKEGGEALFDGRIWSGERAVALGLVDGLAEPHAFIRARYGEEARLRVIEPRRGWLARRLPFGSMAGEVMAQALAQVEERAAFARFGL